MLCRFSLNGCGDPVRSPWRAITLGGRAAERQSSSGGGARAPGVMNHSRRGCSWTPTPATLVAESVEGGNAAVGEGTLTPPGESLPVSQAGAAGDAVGLMPLP